MSRYAAERLAQLRMQTRRRLLDAALPGFSRQGFEAVTVEQICVAAGLAKGTFYNYFPSKRDLLFDLIAEIGALHVALIRTHVLAYVTPEERLRAFYRAGFNYVQENLEAARLALSTLNSPDHEINLCLYKAYLPLFELVASEIIAPGVQSGLFRPCDPVATAQLVITLYLGLAASVDPVGKPYIQAGFAAEFALAALIRDEVSR
jgi:AcrR family transcriptional regulator